MEKKDWDFSRRLLRQFKTYTRYRLAVTTYHAIQRMVDRDVNYSQYRNLVSRSKVVYYEEREPGRFMLHLVSFIQKGKNRRLKWYKIIVEAKVSPLMFKTVTLYAIEPPENKELWL